MRDDDRGQIIAHIEYWRSELPLKCCRFTVAHWPILQVIGPISELLLIISWSMANDSSTDHQRSNWKAEKSATSFISPEFQWQSMSSCSFHSFIRSFILFSWFGGVWWGRHFKCCSKASNEFNCSQCSILTLSFEHVPIILYTQRLLFNHRSLFIALVYAKQKKASALTSHS